MCEVSRKLLVLLFAVAVAGCNVGEPSLKERLRERRRKRLERRGELVVEEDYEGVNTGRDFTRPFARTEFLYRYTRLTGDLEGSTFIHRLIAPYRFKSGWIFSGRYEIPLIYSDVPSRDNPNGDYEFGLGDIGTQLLFIRPTTTRWAIAGGVQLLWPTASQDQMGRGKYIAGPTLGGTYHPESWKSGGFVGALFTNFFDYEGKADRKDIHQLLVQPILNYNFEIGESFWFVTFVPEVNINWEENNDMFLPLKASIGRLFSENAVGTAGLSVPVVNDFDLYDWQVELSASFFF
ncbi:MAG: hypothetical protein ACYTFQ_09080 [Planctomycetota bacterium]|jgi:hypothetical protein